MKAECRTFTLLAMLLTLCSNPTVCNMALDQDVVGYDEAVIIDILNQTVSGQCLVPMICLDKGDSCGIDANHHVVVNCSYRQVGPYAPSFQPYILPRRTWDFDFSNNGITDLDSSSFMAPYNVSVNLTRLILSNNFIRYIAANTFRGEISKELKLIDLSSNNLQKLEADTFKDTPALENLILSNNMLLSIDTLCATSFPSLISLDVEGNKLTRLARECLSSSAKMVSLMMGYNYLGSIDDCSYSDKVRAEVTPNPFLCGCSSKFSGNSCLRIDPMTNTSTTSTQPSCASGSCLDISFVTSYERMDGRQDVYTANVQLSDNMEYLVEVLQYTVSVDNSYTAKLVQSELTKASQFSSKQMDTSNEYSVCVTAGSDSERQHTSCEYMMPPVYYVSAAGHSVAAFGLLLLAGLVAIVD